MENAFRQLSARVERAFRYSTPTKVAGGRRAIVGPHNFSKLVQEAEEARQILLKGGEPNPVQWAAIEQAIRLQRPAPTCNRDGITVLPQEGNWLAEVWTKFQPMLQQLQRSVARLDRIDDPEGGVNGLTAFGTGFLVAADKLMTAAHVVDQLSFSTGRLERGQAIAEFESYYHQATSETREIVSVLAIDHEIDLALLQINPIDVDDGSRPLLLNKQSRAVPEFPVCVIGYPLNDPRNPHPLVALLFGDGFKIKRAALGEIIDVAPTRFSHDCSTLGGNSGSPVIDLSTGLVCGIHVQGESLMRNEAVSAAVATEFMSGKPKPPDRRKTSRPAATLQHNLVFDDFFREFRNVDAELKAELDAAFEDAEKKESVAGAGNPFLRETIVLTKGRPVLDIKNGDTIIDFNEVESEIWRKRLSDADRLLAPNISAVGRIELVNHPRGVPWIGTGWLLKDNVVVTNRHVVEEFGEAYGSDFVFRLGIDGSMMRANIDFLEEFGNDNRREFPLFKIMHIERGGGPDLAFLRIEPIDGQSLPQPVRISSTSAQPGEQVAVIGYPARDPSFPDPQEMDRIFNNRYDKKRLAPGFITGKEADRIFHDCSTLGGNSGGEVVSLRTGDALALHFAGTLFKKNHAVPIETVAQRLDDVLNHRFKQSWNVTATSQEVSNVQSKIDSGVIEITIPVKLRVEVGNHSTTGNEPI